MACWPRRHGKDDVGLHHMCCAAHERKGNYWYMLPEYAQARKSVWDAINPHTGIRRMEEAFPVALRASTNDHEMKIVLACGSTIQLVGSDNFLALLGAAPIGLVFSEWKIANASAWAYLRPILLENGGWAYFNSTPQGKNHFYKLCVMAEREQAQGRDWFYEKLTNDETRLFTEEEMQRELRELQAEHGEQFGRSIWLQEYYTSFEAAVLGSIWGDCVVLAQEQGRITDFPVLPDVVVDTGWDLGRTDDTAIWFRQMVGKEMHIIDHFSSAFMDICNELDTTKSLVHILLRIAKKHGIQFGIHWLPHDARPRTLAAGGKSILQQFQDAARIYPKLGRFVIGKRLDRQEGIAAGRKTFQVSRFHASNCAKGLESLRMYQRQWDDVNKVFLDTPKHDHSSHDADAWRTLSLSWKVAKPTQPDSPLASLLQKDITQQTLGSFRKAHLAKRKSARALSWS